LEAKNSLGEEREREMARKRESDAMGFWGRRTIGKILTGCISKLK